MGVYFLCENAFLNVCVCLRVDFNVGLIGKLGISLFFFFLNINFN